MKKSNLLICAAVALMGTACSENEVLVDVTPEVTPTGTKAIAFDNALLENTTRAAYGPGATFAVDDAFGVYGFQNTTGVGMDQIFNNQKVTKGATKWTYSPEKYWNAGSTYEFYAIFPQSADSKYSFDVTNRVFTIPSVTLSETEQQDWMIAQKNATNPYNLVNLVFNHLLSNVNVNISLKSGLNGVEKAEVLFFDLVQAKNTGTFEQAATATGVAVAGAWSAQAGAFDYTAQTTATDVKSTSYKVVENLMMVPQTFAAMGTDCAYLAISYKLTYTDETTQTFTKNIPFLSAKTAAGKAIKEWALNTRYTYNLVINPANRTVTYPIDHNGGVNGDDKPESTLINMGDIDGDGKDDFFVDTDNDGIPDIPVVWKDLDGDGKEEGYADKDGDGEPDNWDGNTDGSSEDGNGNDFIRVDTDGDGTADTTLTRDADGKTNPEDIGDTESAAIEFTGTVEDWQNADAAEQEI